jgi:hypothetical protein
MDTTGLIEQLRQDLARAAEVGGIEVQVAAERLLLALEPAVRLTLMDALGQAAGEIAEQLPGVAIDVRLAGREPQLVVTGAPRASEPEPPPDAEIPEAEDGEAVIRITLRLPEALKGRAEQLAVRRGQSLNTWLVGAVRVAASDRAEEREHRHDHRGRHGRGQRIQGWAK